MLAPSSSIELLFPDKQDDQVSRRTSLVLEDLPGRLEFAASFISFRPLLAK